MQEETQLEDCRQIEYDLGANTGDSRQQLFTSEPQLLENTGPQEGFFMQEGMLMLNDQEESERKMYTHQHQMGSSSTKGGDYDTNENDEEFHGQPIDEFNAYNNDSQDYSKEDKLNHPMMIQAYRKENGDLESIAGSKTLIDGHGHSVNVYENKHQFPLQTHTIHSRTQATIENGETVESNSNIRHDLHMPSDVEQMTEKTIVQDVGVAQFFEYTEVFVWGESHSGQLGIDAQLKLNPGSKRPEFIQIPKSCSFNIVITEVSCGESHSGILTNQGHLYMMGSNKMGQLGVQNAATPMQACQQILNEEDRFKVGSPCLVEGLKSHHVHQVSCGRDFTIAIATQARVSEEQPLAQVYAWGSNRHGQLGVELTSDHTSQPTRIEAFDVLDEEITQVSCGYSHSLFLTSDQDVISCGGGGSLAVLVRPLAVPQYKNVLSVKGHFSNEPVQ